jgi:hypothetical protein
MRKVLAAGAAVVVLAGLAYVVHAQRGSADLAGYKNVNVNLGAVSTAAADEMCTQTGHPRLVCLADGLKADLAPDLRAKLQLPYSTQDARKWSNFPPMGYRERVGPTLGDFTAEQLGIIKAMLTEAAGIARDEGYDELEQILNADDFLLQETGEQGFSSSNFHIAFLGDPAATGTWELYFGGHHTAVGNTYRDGQLVGATPSFRGVEPFSNFAMNGRDNAPMLQEVSAFAAMLAALTPAEQATAKLGEAFSDIVVGPQKDDNFPTEREGVRAGDLNPAQQAAVMRAIKTYVGDIFVSFSGTPEMNAENDYVRIDGPSVWIELSMQPGRSLPGVHPHSVWRDRKTDYAGNT